MMVHKVRAVRVPWLLLERGDLLAFLRSFEKISIRFPQEHIGDNLIDTFALLFLLLFKRQIGILV
jgi:hypothetical protein